LEIPLEKRAAIIPDDKIESELIMGDSDIMSEFLEKYETGISVKRKEYLIKNAPIRNRNLSRKLFEMYSGSCQICNWTPIEIYGVEVCETHHIQWISRGGSDELMNLVLICPNHHRAIHKCDASFDYKSQSFNFGILVEKLKLNNHLL
jgi:5-methylcytosine-specific restriction enzyme A